jgi:hypothetical protein
MIETATVSWDKVVGAVATVLAALIAAFLGSWAGAQAALNRFKRERAFDRRVDWYERMAHSLAEMKLRIEIARTFQEDPLEPPEKKRSVWGGVQQQYIELTRTVAEAKLYAAVRVITAIDQLLAEFDKVSDETNGFDVSELPKHMGRLNDLITKSEKALTTHADAFRKELGYDTLSKE